MAQRNSEYERIPGDLYVTPQWVWDALYEVEEFKGAWDCAPVDSAYDFLGVYTTDSRKIATNPPFNLSEKFVRHALALTKGHAGAVAMLLPMAWDTAKGRRDLFEQAPFKAKYTLTKRIRWENLEQKKNGPSSNHAWFVFDWTYTGRPFLGYLP